MLILMHFCTNSWEGEKNEINFNFEYIIAEVQYELILNPQWEPYLNFYGI